jgi:hypothetical protein
LPGRTNSPKKREKSQRLVRMRKAMKVAQKHLQVWSVHPD